MTGGQCEKRRVQKMKSKRKQVLVKKAYELSKLCQLNVNLVVFDPESNVLQEFSSTPEFTSEHVVDHKKRFKSLRVNASRIDERKYFPQKNFIEQTQMIDFMQGFKNLRKTKKDLHGTEQPSLAGAGKKRQRIELETETFSASSSDESDSIINEDELFVAHNLKNASSRMLLTKPSSRIILPQPKVCK